MPSAVRGKDGADTLFAVRARGGRWILSLGVVAGCGGCPEPSEHVSVVRADGRAELSVCAAIASSEEDRRRGLMGSAPLEPGGGLLLIVPVDQELCVYNAGVGFPIDVLFADASGFVVGLERAIPAGDERVRCYAHVSQILEVAAGELAPFSAGDALIR